MANFRYIGQADPQPLLSELAAHPDLWNQNRSRTGSETSPHREASDIILRHTPYAALLPLLFRNNFLAAAADLRRQDFAPFAAIPSARFVVSRLARFLGAAELGSIVITKLPAGSVIHPHSDRILDAEAAYPDRVPPAIYFDRFQVILQGQCTFWCDEDWQLMQPGEVWWFDNAKQHGLLAHQERIAMIVDLRLREPMARS